jgi:hypothetical protein
VSESDGKLNFANTARNLIGKDERRTAYIRSKDTTKSGSVQYLPESNLVENRLNSAARYSEATRVKQNMTRPTTYSAVSKGGDDSVFVLLALFRTAGFRGVLVAAA